MIDHRPDRGLLAVLVGGLSSAVLGCATPSSAPAPQVIPVDGILGAPCQNLGTVIGQTEAKSWGSGSTPAEQLASEAMGDAMHRAAMRGATHIFLSPVTVQQKDGAPFSATMTGVAFRCPTQ